MMLVWRFRTLLECSPYVLRRWKSTSGTKQINKILIANRGEIACRVLRTANQLGIKTVAVYSKADENALHVKEADEAYNIGPPPATQSYLRGDKLLEIARQSGCQAIHPGYGFLSENVEFAENCEKSNIVFIGPPASAIRDMGIKSKSKEIMSRAGVPIIEGYHGIEQNISKLREEAHRIGFPIMIKAVRGGGGKGMRIAMTPADFDEALESAKRESLKAFGDDVMLLEKFVAEPRHVEVQVFADTHGNAVHLFERDCSVQRRHQKIIEEAPAPGISEKLRLELGAAAVRAAQAVGYVGAGTVEFILDRVNHSFHFMEMNTRLQVEHPITEMVTGTDLVEWQIKVARGEKLPRTQEQINLTGHAFEARIYAEDTKGGFLPGAGTLSYLSTPPSNEYTRIETGVRQGDEVSIHYDPMIAKLVVWGKTRTESLSKLHSSLLQYNIAGLETNINFLLDLSNHPEFIAGNVHTNFIQENYDSLFLKRVVKETQITQAALGMILQEKRNDVDNAVREKNQFNPFVLETGFRVNYQHVQTIKLKSEGKDILVKVKYLEGDLFYIQINDGGWSKVRAVLEKAGNKTLLRTTSDNVTNQVVVFQNNDIIAVFDNTGKTEFSIEKPSYLSLESSEDVAGGLLDGASSPMPGVLDKILIKIGDEVKKGDSLFVLIAMKMEHVVKAQRNAVIENILFKVGDSVLKDVKIVKFREK